MGSILGWKWYKFQQHFLIASNQVQQYINYTKIMQTSAEQPTSENNLSSEPLAQDTYSEQPTLNNGQEHQQNSMMDPQQYSISYYNLTQQQKQYYWPPQQYKQWYILTYYQNVGGCQLNHIQNYYGMGNVNYVNGYQWQTNYANVPIQKEKDSNKLSRNQKRKIRKKKLQEEYDQEKKKIGKWVDLERKDLVQDIKKIEEQEQKLKEKRRQKLSHLIEIHKEIYKHMLKKNKGNLQSKREHVGNFRKKKKKPSHIKRMKQLYEEVRVGKLKQNYFLEKDKIIIKTEVKQEQKVEPAIQQNQEDYVTESEGEGETQKQLKTRQNKQKRNKNWKKSKKEKKQSPKKSEGKKQQLDQQQIQPESNCNSKQEQAQKQIKIINYNKVGKLTGYVYNGITLREWVDNVPTTKLQDITLKLINRLAYKQAIKKINQPEKAKKLVTSGFHECKRTLWTKIDKKRAQILVVALNIERNNLEKGTDHQLLEVLGYAQAIKMPVIHISTRSKLGRAFTGKFGPRITMVSIINYEGYEDMVEALLEQHKEARRIYEETNQYSFKF